MEMNMTETVSMLPSKLEKALLNVDEMAQYALQIEDEVVKQYTGDLDTLMEKIKEEIIDGTDLPDIDLLEKYFLELTNTLYFVASQVERSGVYSSLSKIAYKESYNKFYMNPTLDKAKPTVAELTAFAETESIYDQTVNEIYTKAYKALQLKVAAAETMIATLSKIVSRRISEQKLSAMQPLSVSAGLPPENTTRQILNEMDMQIY